MVDQYIREREMAAQRVRLAGIQKGHSDILTHTELALRASYVKRRRSGTELTYNPTETTPYTRFVASRLAGLDNDPNVQERFYITRFEGEERQWSIEVGKKLKDQSNPEPSSVFALEDVILVSGLTDHLGGLKTSGELSRLNTTYTGIE